MEKAYAFQKKILIIDDINDTGETFNYINKNFGGEDRVRTAAIIHNAPSKFEKLNYYCYGIDKDVLPVGLFFLGGMVMIKVDTLEQAKKEGRASLERCPYDSKDMVWYNDGLKLIILEILSQKDIV